MKHSELTVGTVYTLRDGFYYQLLDTQRYAQRRVRKVNEAGYPYRVDEWYVNPKGMYVKTRRVAYSRDEMYKIAAGVVNHEPEIVNTATAIELFIHLSQFSGYAKDAIELWVERDKRQIDKMNEQNRCNALASILTYTLLSATGEMHTDFNSEAALKRLIQAAELLERQSKAS